jgi:p21-activated kinase 1
MYQPEQPLYTPVEPSIISSLDSPSIEASTSTSSTLGSRSRSGTTSKKNKGFLNMLPEFLHSQKKPEISTPYDPVHLTHVGFNSSTGEFTGLPKEWQQLLQDSGISRFEQEKNPQAVMEIVKFYQEGGGDVWDKMGMGGAAIQGTEPISASIPQTTNNAFQNPVRNLPYD